MAAAHKLDEVFGRFDSALQQFEAAGVAGFAGIGASLGEDGIEGTWDRGIVGSSRGNAAIPMPFGVRTGRSSDSASMPYDARRF